MTKQEKNEVVEETLAKMGLQECAEIHIGNWHLRGISNGEKRRLSICIEILTQPRVLLLDEPTRCLDGASSFFVVWALRNIAQDGRIVVCSHQPSSDVFNLFSDLVLIAGGETVYFGEAHKAVKFLSDAGFPCSTRKSPPDHYLRCITPDFDRAITALILSQKLNHVIFPFKTLHVAHCSFLAFIDLLWVFSCRDHHHLIKFPYEPDKGTLINKYNASQFSIDARKRIRDYLLTEYISSNSKKSNSISWWKQLWTLTSRTSLNMSREVGYYCLRSVFYILIAVSAGSFFYHTGTSSQAIVSRGKCDAFIYALMICLSIGGMPSFIEELKVFRRERLGGHYGKALFVLSNFISAMPFVVLMAFSAGTILYYMVKFRTGFSHFLYFCMNLLCCIVVTEGTALIVAVLVPNFLMGMGCAAAVTVFMMMPTLFFRRVSELPKFFWQYPMSYLSYAGWSIEGQLKNDMISIEFESPMQGEPKLKGEDILLEMFGVNPTSSKWWNLAALACLLVGLRLIFYVALKYKERSSLFFQKLYAKKTTFQNHVKVSSSRKDQFISSNTKTHRTLNSLSSEEGLPLPLP